MRAGGRASSSCFALRRLLAAVERLVGHVSVRVGPMKERVAPLEKLHIVLELAIREPLHRNLLAHALRVEHLLEEPQVAHPRLAVPCAVERQLVQRHLAREYGVDDLAVRNAVAQVLRGEGGAGAVG